MRVRAPPSAPRRRERRFVHAGVFFLHASWRRERLTAAHPPSHRCCSSVPWLGLIPVRHQFLTRLLLVGPISTAIPYAYRAHDRGLLGEICQVTPSPEHLSDGPQLEPLGQRIQQEQQRIPVDGVGKAGTLFPQYSERFLRDLFRRDAPRLHAFHDGLEPRGVAGVQLRFGAESVQRAG